MSIVFLFTSFFPLVIIFSTIITSIEDYYKQDREKALLTNSNIIAGNISKGNYLFDETKRPLFDTEIENKSKEGNFRVMVVDRMGTVVHDSNLTEIGNTLISPEVISALEKNNKVTTNVSQETVYAAASIVNEFSEKVGAVLVVASVSDIFGSISEIERKLAIFTIMIILILIVLVFIISHLLLEPIKSFLRVVQKTSEGHLNVRVDVKGHDEFTQLAIAFNNMAGKIEQAEKTREEFVSNVSHELKTPLSSIKVLTEAILLQENVPEEMYTEFLQDINSEIDRMTNIINDLLNLVKLDQREIPLNIKQTDINKMIDDILKRLLPLAGQKDIKLTYEALKKVVIQADEMKLSLAISNLVENGIKYTPSGGKVKVIVDSDHQNCFITVQDTGIGMKEEEQTKIFTRFYRIDKTRDRETGGTGLGLSITHSTILLHNGSIKVTSKENEGTTFVVRLPIQYTV